MQTTALTSPAVHPAPPLANEPQMHNTTIIRRFATLIGCLVMAAVATALPANASVTDANGTTTGYAQCNPTSHQMSMQGTFRLADSYPNGAWIASRYAYWQVSPSTGQRTGTVYYTAFRTSWALPGTAHIPYTELGGAEFVAQNSNLPAVTINNQMGRLKVAVQVEVYTGSGWVWSAFDTVYSYATTSPYGLYTSSMCIGSV
jgi:hypothetical protein